MARLAQAEGRLAEESRLKDEAEGKLVESAEELERCRA